ncbi:MAG: DUF3299 domain-containing protein [Rhodobacteraceae bacterium]|nr:DUF3299 domain-containing protein [Paracoccaceae bacterium]
MRVLIFICVVALAPFLAPSQSRAAEPVSWERLIDQSVQEYEDPYRDLTMDHIDALRAILRSRHAVEMGGLTEEESQAASAAETDALAELARDGIDGNWLLEQRWVVMERRRKAATSGNPEVDGQAVDLAGFVIPAPPTEEGEAIAYLVPERGMCSHMPPPNPNQMIRLMLNGDWRPERLHEPVRVQGTLRISPSERQVFVVDGPVAMNATFDLDVAQVEPLATRLSQPDKGNDWIAELKKKLNANSGAHTGQ